jgi:outer membrane protein OmpA-like peptidoglycan-associated protein
MIQERRKFNRDDIFLIVNFRQLKESHEYSYGITDNLSQEGIKLESQNHVHKPGELLNIELKHPQTELSVSIEGEIVWKRHGWYKSETGIRFRKKEGNTNNDAFQLISNLTKIPVNFFTHKDNGKEEGKERDIHMNASNLIKREKPSLSDTVYLMGSHANLEDSTDKQSSGSKIPIPAEKNYRTVSGGIIPKKLSFNKPQKTNRIFMTILMVFTVIILAIMIVRIEYIKKVLSPHIQMMQLVIPHKNTARHDDSFADTIEANKEEILVADDMSQLSTYKELNNTSLTIETNSQDKHYESPSAMNHANVKKISEHVINKDVIKSDGLPMHESASDNNLEEMIIFDYDSDVVSPFLYSKIEKIADVLLNNSENSVSVEGYTDNIGTKIYNIDLAMRRALAVRKILIQKGIGIERIKIASLGETLPVGSNSTESGRRINRRVEIKIVSDIP